MNRIVRVLITTAYMLLSLAAHAQGDKPSVLTEQQALESVRKAGELAIEQSKSALEQSRKSFEMATELNKLTLERTNAIALQAIQAAKDSNDTTRAMFTFGTAIVTAVFAIIGGLALWLGIKEYRDLRTRLETSFKAELELLSAQFELESKKIQTMASRISIAIPLFTTAYNKFLDGLGKMSEERRGDTADWLQERAKAIEVYADQLKDKRTVSWVHSQYALLCFFQEQYLEALEWQTKACGYLAPDAKYDRERNLACIAAKVYQTTKDGDARTLATNTLKSLENYVTRLQACDMLDDDKELEVVFDADPSRLQALQRKAGRWQPGP